MEALTRSGRDVGRPSNALRLIVLVSLLGGAAVGCIGEQSRPGSEEATEEEIELPFDPDDVFSGVFVDSAATLSYHTFETIVESEHPRKMMYRIMALELGDTESLTKTLRTALDSVARADSGVVAARATLYTFRPTGPRKGILTARVWAEWLPPSGWDDAGTAADASAAPYRIYTYDRQPSWHRLPSGGS